MFPWTTILIEYFFLEATIRSSCSCNILFVHVQFYSMLSFISVFSEQLNVQLSFICIMHRSKIHGVDCRMHDRKTLGQAFYMTSNYCISFCVSQYSMWKWKPNNTYCSQIQHLLWSTQHYITMLIATITIPGWWGNIVPKHQSNELLGHPPTHQFKHLAATRHVSPNH
jgi:hypothetical protein